MITVTKKKILGDFCTITDCEHKTAPTEETGIPLIRTPNIGRGRLILDDVQRVSERTYKLWTRRGEPKAGDLIMAREAPVGNVAIVPRDEKVCLGQRTVLIRVKDATELDAAYLNYLLNSDAMHAYLNLLSTGATVGHLNVTDIRRLALPHFPKKHTQEKTAAILSAYDELIENNRRRIALLEKLAEEIYREWFVRLRFPDHEKVKKSRRVPEGWREAKLGILIPETGLQTGKRPKGGAEESGIPSIGAENVTKLAEYDFTKEKYVSEQFFDSMRQGHVADRDILFYKDGAEIGRVTLVQDGFPHEKCCVNEHVFLIRTHDLSAQYFLYFYLSQPVIQEYVKTINKNAAQPGINKTELRSIPIVLPRTSVIVEFESLVCPIIRQIFQLAKSQRLLSKTRDLLLPRLISGKLSVEHLDIQFPPGMKEEMEAAA